MGSFRIPRKVEYIENKANATHGVLAGNAGKPLIRDGVKCSPNIPAALTCYEKCYGRDGRQIEGKAGKGAVFLSLWLERSHHL